MPTGRFALALPHHISDRVAGGTLGKTASNESAGATHRTGWESLRASRGQHGAARAVRQRAIPADEARVAGGSRLNGIYRSQVGSWRGPDAQAGYCAMQHAVIRFGN